MENQTRNSKNTAQRRSDSAKKRTVGSGSESGNRRDGEPSFRDVGSKSAPRRNSEKSIRQERRSTASGREQHTSSKVGTASRKPSARRNVNAPPTSRSEVVRASSERRKKKKKRSDAFIVIVIMLMLAAVGFVFCTTVLFKTEEIFVNNQDSRYSESEIIIASGISKGDSIITANTRKAAKAIEKALPYIKSATVKRRWPDAMFIDAEYVDTVLAVKKGSAYVYIDSNGKVLETDIAVPAENTAPVTGLEADAAEKGKTVIIKDKLLVSTSSADEDADVQTTVCNEDEYCGEKLLANLTGLMKLLEDNGIGNVTAVNIENISFVTVELDHRIEVRLGGLSSIADKIAFGKTVIEENVNEDSSQEIIIDLTIDSRAFVRNKDKLQPTAPIDPTGEATTADNTGNDVVSEDVTTPDDIGSDDGESDDDRDEPYDDSYDDTYDDSYDDILND